MDVRRTTCYDQALACDLFDKFCNANNLKDILSHFHQICKVCKICPTNFSEFYPKIKAKIPSWRAGELWAKFDKRASQKCYGRNTFAEDTRVLIIGGGPCGLRTAIESQMLGAKTVLVEKRESFSRNNILHLWPFTITDLRNLGAKIFYGKFCAGSIDHISIRQLQCILLKMALLLGVEVHSNVSVEGLIEPQDENDLGWKASVLPKEHPVSQFYFDVVIGADGRRNTLPGFRRKAMRAKLALAITANFIHNHTEAEARVQEISGVSYIFKQEFFQELELAMGISLENIVYYKDETHYFVMTPTKQTLLDKGVLYQDFSDPEQLLSPENIDSEALQLFTMEAVVFATDNRLPDLQFASNSRGEPDLALFDFTTMYASEQACRAIERKGHKLLMGLVGDSLLEPFWPTGSGLARGFLAASDVGWMIRSWGKGLKSVYEVIAERESIYRLLAQTTHENLSKDHNQYTIDPTTRYPKINLSSVGPRQVRALFDSDEEIKDIFMSIRESKRTKLASVDVILKWFSNQLLDAGIKVDNVLDIFNNGETLIKIVNRFRPDLIDFPLNLDGSGNNPALNNQLVFNILLEEYEIPIFMSGESSVKCTEKDMPEAIQYLSQVYNVFKGEIPRHINADVIKKDDDLCLTECTATTAVPNLNNSALHHSLSIKQFLQAKESLKEKKAVEEAQSKRERRRSQFYESIMQTQSNYNQQRSTSSVNIPVVKLNPVPPCELFSACRNGSDKVTFDRTDPTDPIITTKLKRSRSDVGFRSNNNINNKGPSSSLLAAQQKRSELEEMQRRITKSKVTPLGDISTFLGKHINSGCSSNGESDENPLSSERRHLRPARPQSVYQNVNDSLSNYSEDQGNVKPAAATYNPFLNNPEQDAGFKERCKFMEKNLYNSGRDIKVHIGAAWFAKQDGKKNNSPHATNPLQKSQSSAVAAGFHPLKRGSSSFNVKGRMEENSSFNIKKETEKSQKELNSKALFLEKRLGIMVNRHVPQEWRSQEKSPSPKPKNDHKYYDPNPNRYHYPFQHQQHQQSGTVREVKTSQNNKGKTQTGKKLDVVASSSATDSNSNLNSDFDCFLNTIDFTSIDGQDLQELLSSY